MYIRFRCYVKAMNPCIYFSRYVRFVTIFDLENRPRQHCAYNANHDGCHPVQYEYSYSYYRLLTHKKSSTDDVTELKLTTHTVSDTKLQVL
jgi:hypothetical protein